MILRQAPSQMSSLPAIEHSARQHTSFPGSNYIFPSDELEKERLERQHENWKQAFNGRVICPPLHFQADSQHEILDCGTGTGVWLLDVAKIVPASLKLHGLDIEPRLFPSIYPENVRFSARSVSALPSDWTNKFSLVHQRLLMGAHEKREWPLIIEELYRVVKPNGWVQLFEGGPLVGGPFTKQLTSLISALYVSRHLFEDIGAHIPEMLENAGFINVHAEVREMPVGAWAGEAGSRWRDNCIAYYIAAKSSVLNGGGFGIVKSEEEFESLVEEAKKECDLTPGTSKQIFMVYAQKKA